MNTPTNGHGTSHEQIVVEWTAHTSSMNGGSTVLEYELEEDSSSWTSLFTSTDLATTYTKSSDVSSDTAYQFRLRMRNIYGWGPYSGVLSLTTPSGPPPDKVSTPSLSIDLSNGNVVVDWSAPGDNGFAISGYEVVFEDSDGSTHTSS